MAPAPSRGGEGGPLVKPSRLRFGHNSTHKFGVVVPERTEKLENEEEEEAME